MNSVMLNETHDPARRSWEESSQDPASDFPIQNLPWCVFSDEKQPRPRIGVGIGQFVLDVQRVIREGISPNPGWGAETLAALHESSLNQLMALPSPTQSELRKWFSSLLEQNNSVLRDDLKLRPQAMLLQSSVQFHLPSRIGDYTDFYASIHHATNVGTMLRPEQPLFPNYKWLPVAYHGRASSVVSSGHPVHIPSGQTAPPSDAHTPIFQKTRALDYELELGFWISGGNSLGTSIGMERAEEAFFGACLLNDWSARDIQRWEYQPLGPFLAKNFLTSVSPWVVTREALAPFRIPPNPRAAGDPQPLPHLDSSFHQQFGGIEVQLEVLLSSLAMRDRGLSDIIMSRGNFRDMYWTVSQMIAHHSSNGCNLQSGDLLGSGTVSGPERTSRGCLLELTWDGSADHPLPNHQRTPIQLPSGETRLFLAEGDRITLRGWCERADYPRIGFGKCEGTVTS
jgi:fumarylacetoacetase